MNDDSQMSFVSAAVAAIERISEMAQERPSTSDVLARWSPMVGAMQRFGFTLFQVGNHLWALSKSEVDELMPADLAAEVRQDLKAISEAFPGIDEVIFGTDAIDEFIDHAVQNEGVQLAFKTAGGVVASRFEAMVERLIAAAFDPESATMSGGDLTVYFRRLERVLDKILDRWLEEAAP